MATVYVNIGSNLGSRKENIDKAINAIKEKFGEIKVSSPVESEPWGFDSTELFLNIGVSFRSRLEPREILRLLLEIEKRISPASHRKADGTYADRIIDIDIMAIDERVIKEEGLEVPHPRLREREFFMKPLLELAPGWKFPPEIDDSE